VVLVNEVEELNRQPCSAKFGSYAEVTHGYLASHQIEEDVAPQRLISNARGGNERSPLGAFPKGGIREKSEAVTILFRQSNDRIKRRSARLYFR